MDSIDHAYPVPMFLWSPPYLLNGVFLVVALKTYCGCCWPSPHWTEVCGFLTLWMLQKKDLVVVRNVKLSCTWLLNPGFNLALIPCKPFFPLLGSSRWDVADWLGLWFWQVVLQRMREYWNASSMVETFWFADCALLLEVDARSEPCTKRTEQEQDGLK